MTLQSLIRTVVKTYKTVSVLNAVPDAKWDAYTKVLSRLITQGRGSMVVILSLRDLRVDFELTAPEWDSHQEAVERFVEWLGRVTPAKAGADLASLVKGSKRGDTILLAPGTYDHARLQRDSEDEGLGFTTIMAWPQHTAMIQNNPVGGSNTLSIRSSSMHLDGLVIQGDDKAGIEFYDNFPVSNILLTNLRFLHGFTGGREWGIHGYSVGDLTVANTEMLGLEKGEHGIYLQPHGYCGRYMFDRVTVKRSGRTHSQIVSRNGKPRPQPGKLDWYGCVAEDNGLEDGGGGSAFTIRGGMKDHEATFYGCVSRQGCDPTLPVDLGRNITGSMVVDAGSDKSGGSWDGAGVAKLTLSECHFEVGSVYGGDRPNVMISHTPFVELMANTIINHPGSQPVALQLDRDTIQTLKVHPQKRIQGRISWGGAIYEGWDAFLAGTADDQRVVRP